MPEPWLRCTARPADSPNAITSPCSADAPGHAQAWHCQHVHGLACKPEPPGSCKVRAQALTVAASALWIRPAALKCIRAGGPVVFITTEPSCPVKCSGCKSQHVHDRADSSDQAGVQLILMQSVHVWAAPAATHCQALTGIGALHGFGAMHGIGAPHGICALRAVICRRRSRGGLRAVVRHLQRADLMRTDY